DDMTRRIKTRQARPTPSFQAPAAAEKSDSVAAAPASAPAADSLAPDAKGHDFGRVAIYPDVAPEQQTARVAESGFQGPARDFPFRDRIEASFGRPIPAQAHADQRAAEACDTLGASAFTSAGQVAFATGNPSLEVAAHEAAHAVQQREG